jgi:hypothetical protein
MSLTGWPSMSLLKVRDPVLRCNISLPQRVLLRGETLRGCSLGAVLKDWSCVAEKMLLLTVIYRIDKRAVKVEKSRIHQPTFTPFQSPPVRDKDLFFATVIINV